MPVTHCKYTLCSTYDSVAAAMVALSHASTLILDCEARELGRTVGVLSMISIADANARNIFLIDALALPDHTHPSLIALLDILGKEDVVKIMWDGRADALELHETYGVELRGVLDLQLVEVVSRKSMRGETGVMRRRRLATGYFRNMQNDVFNNPGRYEGIHQVMGMNTCLRMRGIVDRKDAAVDALHKSGESELWLRRPLPEILLQYAAHDLELMEQLYTNFMRAGWITARCLPLLKQQSARYVRPLTSRRVKDLHDTRNLSLFVSLEVLDGPSEGARKYLCKGCEQQLTLRCFSTSPGGTGRGDRRLTFCRLCVLLAQRNYEGSRGSWVDV